MRTFLTIVVGTICGTVGLIGARALIGAGRTAYNKKFPENGDDTAGDGNQGVEVVGSENQQQEV